MMATTGKIRQMGARMSVIACGIFMLAALSACQSQNVDFGLPRVAPAGADQNGPVKNGPANGEVIGNGQTRIALLLPKSSAGNGGAIAAEYRNAAELAMNDLGLSSMELVIKDTGGSGGTAIAVTQEAINEGAAAILGPVFSSSVRSASSIALPANRVMVAFSSDPSAAAPGVYLMSFLPDVIADKILTHAIGLGQTSIAAILPNGAYGTLVETQLRKTVASRGGTITGVTRYDYNDASVLQAVEDIKAAAATAQAIFIPDGGTTPVVLARQLAAAGVDLSTKQILGTGLWRTTNLAAPQLQGAIFADMDLSTFTSFKQRYTERYGVEPTLNAGLGYDAVALIAGIVRTNGAAALNRQRLEDVSGFRGTTGVFRFRADGKAERGLAIYQVQNGQAVVTTRAPTSFATN